MIILNVPAFAKWQQKCSPELYFQSGSGTAGREKEHFLLHEVERIRMGRISQFDLFSITGLGRALEKMLNN